MIKIKEGTCKRGKKLKEVPGIKLRRDMQKRKKKLREVLLLFER